MQDYNTYIRQFPVNLTAKMFGYKVKPNFTVENEQQIQNAPTVDFGGARQRRRNRSARALIDAPTQDHAA